MTLCRIYHCGRWLMCMMFFDYWCIQHQEILLRVERIEKKLSRELSGQWIWQLHLITHNQRSISNQSNMHFPDEYPQETFWPVILGWWSHPAKHAIIYILLMRLVIDMGDLWKWKQLEPTTWAGWKCRGSFFQFGILDFGWVNYTTESWGFTTIRTCCHCE